jgi:hypothetical protein
MKKTRFILGIIALFISGSVFFAACTKEGPAGKDGKDGVDGEAGINGTDGTATCIQCHDNTQALFAKTSQWANSTHAVGGHQFENRTTCAACHTSQGFIEQITTDTILVAVADPNPINCYTCHNVHKSYTTGDWALTTVAPVTSRVNNATFDFGNANLCANCHQGRTINPKVTVGGPDVTLTSTRYGMHHGPQANVLKGIGGGCLEFGSGYQNSQHGTSIENGCINCHMSSAVGNLTGGHTMTIANEEEGDNFSGCGGDNCHGDGSTLEDDVAALKTDVQALLDALKLKLDAAGITVAGSMSPIKGTYPSKVAGAYVNYQVITEDRSLGVHNPKYIKKLLENTIAELN